jgi:APA family basic amino acid/polyamine antiporter
MPERPGGSAGAAARLREPVGAVALAGVFLVYAPAALEAGWWLLLGIGVAAALTVVGAIADSGREVRDGPTGEWLALAGRALGASALALTAADHVLGAAARPAAVLLLVAVTVFVLRGGVLRPALARVLGVLVLLLLAAAAVIVLVTPPVVPPSDTVIGGAEGATTAAAYALLLFPPAPAGAPVRPRSVLVTTAVVALAAAALGAGLLLVLGPAALAETPTPLRAAVAGTAAEPLVAIAAVLACLLALVALLRRDASALVRLVRAGELPGPLARTSVRTGAPVAGQLVVCVVSVLSVVILDADALLAFAVGAGLLVLLLRRIEQAELRSWSALVSAAGALVLLLALPAATAAAVAVLLAALLIVRAFRS